MSKVIDKIYHGKSLDTAKLINIMGLDKYVPVSDAWDWCVFDHLPNVLGSLNKGSTLAFIGLTDLKEQIWKVNYNAKEYYYILICEVNENDKVES